MWYCTCSPPPVFDLTSAYCGKEKCSSDDQNAPDVLLLRDSLKKWGWSQVVVDRRKLPTTSPLHCIRAMDEMKKCIHDMFDPSNLVESSQLRQAGVYRGRTSGESGAAASAQAEPKQSWELRRCCRQKVKLPSHQWAEALHSIAVTVTRLLGFSSNLLLREDACHCQQQQTEGTKCNVDLMRVFFYDPVKNHDETTLGSSPHTDWGSWTVVWQDDVGGLQTYCHAHERWVDVAPPPVDDSLMYFVVHLSDITSLAIGHVLSRKSKMQSEDPIVLWPSPRHRVVSPTRSVPRASLVYFAYPPPRVTLCDIEEGLSACFETPSQRVMVPYEAYYVLKNQSSSGDAKSSTSSAKEAYEQMLLRRLDDVFDEKWKQVQRSTE